MQLHELSLKKIFSLKKKKKKVMIIQKNYSFQQQEINAQQTNQIKIPMQC